MRPRDATEGVNENVIEVAAGLVFRQGKLLITQRNTDAHLGGLWEFPGGKREAEETYERCLVRELHEELGIGVEVGSLVESLTHAYPEKTVRLKFYACRVVRGEPRALGCQDIRWVSPAELAEYPFPAADARLLKRLLADAALWGNA